MNAHPPSTLSARVRTSWKDFLENATAQEIEDFINTLDPNALQALTYLFEIWAHPHQIPPQSDYSTWLILAGRGAGKTRAGAEWVRALVEGANPQSPGSYRRLALVGATLQDVCEVMIFGPSGIIANTPPDRQPHWNASRRKLVWPNGAQAHAFSAQRPEALRGPQFDAAWCDEFAKWPDARLNWDMLQFCLRIGDAPKALITTTPKPTPVLQDIMELETTLITKSSTYANQDNLSTRYLEILTSQYENTWLGQQEIHGELITENTNSLWRKEHIKIKQRQDTDFDRLVIAVDPAVSHTQQSDRCGIVIAGAHYPQRDPRSWSATILADETLESAEPEIWVQHVVDLYHQWGASCVVAEVNQGGELIETLLRVHDPYVNYRSVFARKNKSDRAEPVAALYRQSRVTHAKHFRELESQMLQMTAQGYQGKGSPDRLDALVWAVDDLLLDALKEQRTPRLKSL